MGTCKFDILKNILPWVGAIFNMHVDVLITPNVEFKTMIINAALCNGFNPVKAVFIKT